MMTNRGYKQSLENQLVRAESDLAEARMIYRHALQMRDTLAAEMERLKSAQVLLLDEEAPAPSVDTTGLPTARLPRLPALADTEFATPSFFNGCGF